jgi:predicted nucleic acid-binding protein
VAAYFFDSSALVKRYVTESGTQWVRGLCDPTADHTLYISRITGAEVIAALARRAKMGSLTPSAAQSAMAAFRSDFGGAYLVSELTPALVERAMDLAQARGLRGYDAIQLATALDVGAERQRNGLSSLTLISADGDLNSAATAEGLTVENPSNYP